MKDVLLTPLKEIIDKDEHKLKELVCHIKKAEEVARRYEEILKTKCVQTINILGKQFKDSKELFKIVCLSHSKIYLK